MGGIHIPLHISRDDHSPEADACRYQLHERMMALNPKGFRVPAQNGAPVQRYADMLGNAMKAA